MLDWQWVDEMGEAGEMEVGGSSFRLSTEAVHPTTDPA